MRLTSLVALGFVAVACSPKADDAASTNASAANAPLSAAALDSVKAVDAAFARGMNAKDTAVVFAAYAPDAKLMPPDSPAFEGAAGHPQIVGFMNEGATDFALTPTTVYGVGDLAYIVGRATFKMKGAPASLKYTEVLRRGSDGRWRYVVDMFSGDVAPAVAAPVTKK